VFFSHTCGSVVDILDDLVEIGVDILHPMQASAMGMDPAQLKKRWGKQLAFWGVIDTQHVLPHGSPEDMRRVPSLIRQMTRSGSDRGKPSRSKGQIMHRDTTMRKPMAIANWKMEMTISQSLAFVRDFQRLIGELAQAVDVILCPPYTALYPVAQALKESPIQLGAQDLSAASGGAYTGEISAALLADVSCQWVLVGHWEVRRHLGDTDEVVNHKVHRALEAGLRPILLVGEPRGERDHFREALSAQLRQVLAACEAGQVQRMAFVYEPEWSIGAAM